MNRLLIAIFIVTMFSQCNSADNKAASDETSDSSATTSKESEWIILFDGKTTNGWHTYGTDTIGKAWKIQDSALYLDASKLLDESHTKEGGDIITDDEFENFDLKLDWKIAPKGNSGIMIYIHEDTTKFKTPWQSGPEIQVLDNAGHPDAKIKTHRAGDLYDLLSVSKETVKPAGEWNHVEVVSNKGKLDIYLNNEHVIDTTMWNDAWYKMIAKSKFKEFPGFGTYKKGKIGLQDHGFSVWFKNIMIKKL